MSKEFKCIDFNSKQKKHYEKWKKLIKDLSKVNDKKNGKKDKPKTFEDFFPAHTITKYQGVNSLDYMPFLEGAWMIPPTVLLAIVIAAATIVKEYYDTKN